MVEWGNFWARAIRMRDYKSTEAFVGMFSQVGELYNVKHIWCYNSMEDRKHAREVKMEFGNKVEKAGSIRSNKQEIEIFY